MQDSDFLMLENLTYLDGSVSGISFYNSSSDKVGYRSLEQCDTVQQYLSQFGERELATLDSGNADQQEWAARIRYMQQNPDIYSLRVKEYNAENKCLLFEDPNNPNHCIVAFKGTSGDNEWVDNIEGLDRSDTEAQLNAKRYIDGLDYENVTVVGHSKGGNKAMYVAITCDKVDKCISYDGQGFSQEFIDKYSVEIQNNAKKIKNYSLTNDYVHILMFPIPGAEQIYMKPGNRVNKPGGAHYPIGPFTVDCVDGKWVISKDGDIIHITDKEDPAMVILHNFTTFFMNNADKSERSKMVEFLSPLIKMIMKNDRDINEIVDYIKSHREGAVKIAAYLLKYLKENGMGVDELIQICESIGISKDELLEIIGETIGVSPDMAKKILDYAFDQITDGGEDGFTHWLIGIFAGDQAAEIKSWWTAIENEYNNINVTAGSANYKSKIRDYSKDTYQKIMSTISRFENKSLPDVSAWNQYSGHNWFLQFLVPSAIKCINGYRNKLSAINSECRTRAENTFGNIEKVDSRYGRKIESLASKARTLKGMMLNKI